MDECGGMGWDGMGIWIGPDWTGSEEIGSISLHVQTYVLYIKKIKFLDNDHDRIAEYTPLTYALLE